MFLNNNWSALNTVQFYELSLIIQNECNEVMLNIILIACKVALTLGSIGLVCILEFFISFEEFCTFIRGLGSDCLMETIKN